MSRQDTSKKKALKNLCRRYLLGILGCYIGAVGINLFILPVHLLSGGLSGLAIIFYYLMGWPIGVQLIVMNLPLLYMAYRYVGKTYALDTIAGTFLFSFAIDSTSFLAQYHFVQDTMLSAIFGGIVAGAGFGMIFRAGTNTGGMDVIGVVVKKYYSIDVGTVLFLLNMSVILASAFLFDVDVALFTLVAVYASAELTNRFAAGFNREKAILIISQHSDVIGEAILAELNRGVTYFHGRSGFLKAGCDALYVVVNLTQVSKVETLVHRIDGNAFLTVTSVSEVQGRGFTKEKIRYSPTEREQLIAAQNERESSKR